MTDVVSTAWLADNRSAVRIVDVRDDWEYEGIGHVPGAVNIPFERFRGGGETGMLPEREAWSSLLGQAGISPADTIVAYDDEHGVFAARFLVTAELLGHDPDRLRLLDGDYSAWTRSHEVSTASPSIEPATYDLSEPASTPLVEYDAVKAAIDADTVLVDTRDRSEYERSHLPGAVLLDWRDLVDEESRGLKSDDELRAILADRGIAPDRRVLLYCNTARRISHTYVVLRHLGYEDLAFYEGSLTEWEDRGGPVETGASEQ